MNFSSCGIDCDACTFMKEGKCGGCRVVAPKGKCLWGGRCELFDCAAEKALPHCGKCGEFPCQKLIDAHKNGNPNRDDIEIENLRTLVNT